jgi:hypothetical protein
VIRHSFLLALAAAASLSAQTQRPMTFLDAQNMRQTAAPDLSSDGKSMLYTLSIPRLESSAAADLTSIWCRLSADLPARGS